MDGYRGSWPAIGPWPAIGAWPATWAHIRMAALHLVVFFFFFFFFFFCQYIFYKDGQIANRS